MHGSLKGHKMTSKREPSEYIKAIIGVFATLITGAIIYLFSSNLSMQKEIVELKSNQKHLSAESAGSDTTFNSLYMGGDSNNNQKYSVFYIYPQSGEYRPALLYSMYDEDSIELYAGWRNDTVSEITSLEVSGNGAQTVNGTFTLSAIYL